MLDREWEPLTLSRALGEIAARLESFQRSLPHAPALGDPFLGREFPGKTTYDWARSLHETDPLRAALMRWIVRLTDERIHISWRRHEADLIFRTQHPIKEPEDGLLSLADLRLEALTAGSAEALAWWNAWAGAEHELGAHRQRLWARHPEVLARLGIDQDRVLVDPMEQGGDETRTLASLAEQLLRQTSNACFELGGKTFGQLVELGLARDATDGWPARLAPDALRALIGVRELFLGLDLSLPELPARLAPASYVRAGQVVGRALARALARRDLPFVIARSPDDLVGHQTGELIARWMTSTPFFVKVLGVSRHRALEHRRHFDAAWLVKARLSAARYLMARAALGSRDALFERHAEITAQLSEIPWPPSSVLARLGIHLDEGARFAALLAAPARVDQLIQTYDEDWYRSPRCQEQLRSELAQAAPLGVPAAACEQGLAVLTASFS